MTIEGRNITSTQEDQYFHFQCTWVQVAGSVFYGEWPNFQPCFICFPLAPGCGHVKERKARVSNQSGRETTACFEPRTESTLRQMFLPAYFGSIKEVKDAELNREGQFIGKRCKM